MKLQNTEDFCIKLFTYGDLKEWEKLERLLYEYRIW